MIRRYQQWRNCNVSPSEAEDVDLSDSQRASKYRHSAAAGKINMEVVNLCQVLKNAGLWAKVSHLYRPLPVSKLGAGRSLTPEDETKFLEIAFSRARWILAANISRLMLKTGCNFGEIQHLKREDVDLQSATISINVEGSKNEHRIRTIPLIPEALESVAWLLKRWESLGGRLASDYLIPHRANKLHEATDFSRPMGSIKKAWAGIKDHIKQTDPDFYQRVKGFRIHDCRVTAITRTLSDGSVPLHAAQKVFGHVSQAMQRRYYRPEQDALRNALSPLRNTPAAAVEAAQTVSPLDEAARLVKAHGIDADTALRLVMSMAAQNVRRPHA
jgi:integrase